MQTFKLAISSDCAFREHFKYKPKGKAKHHQNMRRRKHSFQILIFHYVSNSYIIPLFLPQFETLLTPAGLKKRIALKKKKKSLPTTEILPQTCKCLKNELDHIQCCLQELKAAIIPLKHAEVLPLFRTGTNMVQ